MTASARSGPKIGVLVPYTNVNLEPDMEMMRPEGCTMHYARLGGYDLKAIPGAEQMAGLGASDIDDTLRTISGVRPSAVLYGCTSATLTHGREFDRALAERIAAESGAMTITAAGALVEAVHALGVKRVGFASPYVGEINDLAVKFLAEEGIETVARADIGRELDNYGQGELTPNEVYELAVQAAGAGVEAIVLSCTDMRAAEAVERIEESTDLPVVTSNQAMVYAVCRALDLPPPAGGQGQLFESMP